jgi:L-lactate utilization protein LutB
MVMPPGIEERAVTEFSRLSSVERLNSVAQALNRNGFQAHSVETGGEARQIVASVLPEGAEVFNNTSRTLESIGVADDIERSGH